MVGVWAPVGGFLLFLDIYQRDVVLRRWFFGGCWGWVYSYGPSFRGCVQLGVGLFMGMDTMRSSGEDGFLEGFICSFPLTHL
jgi:hypothetical protein